MNHFKKFSVFRECHAIENQKSERHAYNGRRFSGASLSRYVHKRIRIHLIYSFNPRKHCQSEKGRYPDLITGRLVHPATLAERSNESPDVTYSCATVRGLHTIPLLVYSEVEPLSIGNM